MRGGNAISPSSVGLRSSQHRDDAVRVDRSMTLADVADAPLPQDRMTGYAIGFFFFWFVCASAGAFTCYMMSTQHEEEPPQD
jgi:hypothetical protein